jgi:hypothetical protein
MAYPPKMYSVQSIAEICDGASKKVGRQPLEGDRVQQFRLARIFHEWPAATADMGVFLGRAVFLTMVTSGFQERRVGTAHNYTKLHAVRSNPSFHPSTIPLFQFPFHHSTIPIFQCPEPILLTF